MDRSRQFRIRSRKNIVGRLVWGSGITAVLIATTVFLLKSGMSVGAAVHEPGVPQLATIIWQEDFETLPYGTPPSLTSDSGRDIHGNGIGYSADPHWQPSYTTNTAFCNGFIVNSNTAAGNAARVSDNCHRFIGRDTSDRQQSAWWFAQNLSHALGLAQGVADPASNNAVVAMTRDDSDTDHEPMPNNGNTMLRTSNLVVEAGHYYQASAWLASTNCVPDTGVGADPELTIGLYANGGGTPIAVSSVDSPCSSGTKQTPDSSGTPFYTNHYSTDIAQLTRELSYSSVVIELRNTQLATSGNDSAFDLPALHDATPRLSQTFSAPTIAGSGFVSTLTYTITNTMELAAKPTFSFTNTLPYGITPVAGSETSTCANQRVSVAGQQVNFSGALLAGEASCVISVDVVAPQSGTYTNDVYNFADYANTGHYKPWGLLEPTAATLTVDTVSRIELTATTDVDSVDEAAKNVVYSFSIANTGNVALANLVLDYSGFSGDSDSVGPITCSKTPFLGLEDLTLQAGENVKCFFTYKVTQEDIDRYGGIDLTNSVVRGTTTTDQSAVVSNSVTLHVAAGATPGLTLAQSAVRGENVAIDAPLVAGETIDYLFVVTNVSNATVRDITIQNTAFSGANSLGIICPQGSLTPFEVMSCTATYGVIAADANMEISSTANARGVGTDKTIEVVVTSASDTTEMPGLATPGLVIANSHTPLPAGDTWAGDYLEYIFTVANTGNVPLDDVLVVSDVHGDGIFDALVGSDCLDWPNLGTLAPGEVVICRANYELTQDDIDRGGAISHVASATGVASGGSSISASATDHEDAYPVTAPDLTLTLTAPSEIKDGDIAYEYTIYNNGNTTLTGVSLSNDISGNGAALVPICTWPSTNGVLAPRQTATCTAIYQTAGSDILAGGAYC